MANEFYFGIEEFARLNSKRVNNAYQRNEISIIVKDNVWWFARATNWPAAEIVRKRMKISFPDLTYLYDRNLDGEIKSAKAKRDSLTQSKQPRTQQKDEIGR